MICYCQEETKNKKQKQITWINKFKKKYSFNTLSISLYGWRAQKKKKKERKGRKEKTEKKEDLIDMSSLS